VSGSLAIDWSLPAFATPTARPIVVTSEASDPARRGEAAAVAEVLVCGEATVDLPAALVGLRERGAAVVLTEGGPRLLAELVGAGLLDELCLTIAPTLGGDPLAILSGAVDLQTLTLAHVLEEDGHLFLRYLTPR
jgi:riboflavin biosynthesis pyrimidine reductase